HPDHEPGSVVFRLQQQPHETFQRQGDDLHTEVSITLLDALAGFRRTLTHVDDKTPVELKRQGVTPPGFVQRLAGKGMPHRRPHPGGAKYGDLLVTYWIQFPVSLSADAKDRIAAVFGADTKWDGTSSESTRDSAAHRGKQAPPAKASAAHDEL
ncbi:hypothetical protein IWW55_003291, partial [Coemansia sp. RSA 2706]